MLRAIALDITGLRVQPQHEIAEEEVWAMVDLAVATLRLVLEAEGFQFHGGRAAFEKDCRRYTGLVCIGWTVLRFTWLQVMKDPDWVRGQLIAAVALCQQRNGRSTASIRSRTAYGPLFLPLRWCGGFLAARSERLGDEVDQLFHAA